MYSAMYVSAKPRSVISGLWCVVLLYIPSRVDTVGLSVDYRTFNSQVTKKINLGTTVSQLFISCAQLRYHESTKMTHVT